MKTLFVGNLPFEVTENDLRSLFRSFGEIGGVRLANDRVGKSRGFGFIEMRDASAAERAMSAMNGVEVGGRTIRVNTAQPLEEVKVGSRIGRDIKAQRRKAS
jgi:RNA recognition motif-containing protein